MNRAPGRIPIEAKVKKGLSYIRNLLDREMQTIRATESAALIFAGGTGGNVFTIRARICENEEVMERSF
ncbi:MAG: hypothetical protein WCU00_05785 [Candidatus Latescibacterota bacterium]